MGTQEASCSLPSCDTWAVGTMQLARYRGEVASKAIRDGQKDIKPLTPHGLCCYMLSESCDVWGVTHRV